MKCYYYPSFRWGNRGTTVTQTQDPSLQRPCPNHWSTLLPLSVLQLIETGIHHKKVRYQGSQAGLCTGKSAHVNYLRDTQCLVLLSILCSNKSNQASQRNGWFESRKYTRWAWSILQGQKGGSTQEAKLWGISEGQKSLMKEPPVTKLKRYTIKWCNTGLPNPRYKHIIYESIQTANKPLNKQE